MQFIIVSQNDRIYIIEFSLSNYSPVSRLLIAHRKNHDCIDIRQKYSKTMISKVPTHCTPTRRHSFPHEIQNVLMKSVIVKVGQNSDNLGYSDFIKSSTPFTYVFVFDFTKS